MIAAASHLAKGEEEVGHVAIHCDSELGYLMLLASGRVKIDLMFASLLTLGVMSMGLYAIITVLLSRMTRFHS